MYYAQCITRALIIYVNKIKSKLFFGKNNEPPQTYRDASLNANKIYMTALIIVSRLPFHASSHRFFSFLEPIPHHDDNRSLRPHF